jgi:hypothetical protein
MDQAAEPAEKGNSKSKWRILAVISLCVLVLANVLYWLLVPQPPRSSARPSATSPPDLSHCTRIRIGCHFFLAQDEIDLLTPGEVNDFMSLKEIIIDDQASIKAMAEGLRHGSFVAGPDKRIAMKPTYDVVGYRDDQAVVSIPVFSFDCIVTSEGYQFRYADGLLPNPWNFAPLQIRCLSLRLACGHNIRQVYYLLQRVNKKAYPSAKEWCDVMVRAARDRQTREEIMHFLVCPSVHGGKCHYAMNPNCRVDSAPDVVLLFETKAGWNQHGGPELFTFDNHDPKGGCVLLNGDTVKFIRTEEELKQLRWE